MRAARAFQAIQTTCAKALWEREPHAAGRSSREQGTHEREEGYSSQCFRILFLEEGEDSEGYIQSDLAGGPF